MANCFIFNINMNEFKIIEVNNSTVLVRIVEQRMTESDEYIIKTKFGQLFDFVYIDESELSFENFVKNGNIIR